MTKSVFLEQVRQTCRLKHFSLKTEKAYLTWIKRFILFNKKRHPKEMGENDISNYLTLLADKANVSASIKTRHPVSSIKTPLSPVERGFQLSDYHSQIIPD